MANEFLLFAQGGSPNIITQAEYNSLPARTAGFATGTAQSDELNKVWRQSAFAAAALGQIISNAGLDALDNGDVATFIARLKQALLTNPGLLGTATAPTLATNDVSTGIANAAFVNNRLAAYYTASQIVANFATIAQVNTAQTTANTANTLATNALNTAGNALTVAQGKGNPQTINLAQRWYKDNDTQVITQWGSVSMTANFFTQGAGAIQTFPIAYTNQVIAIDVIPLSIWWVSCGPDSISLNSFRPWVANSNGNQPYTGSFVWIAKGV